MKEDFGRPNREHTMVTSVPFSISSFSETGSKYLLKFRECGMDVMRNWTMMALHLL